MANEVTVDAVSGLQKRVYDKAGLQKYRPGSAIFQNRIGWDKGSRLVGESYQIPVVLEPPNGFTYSGSAGGVNTLKNPQNMVIKQASIVPFEMELREQASWAALSRAAQEGEGAFAALGNTIHMAMKKSAANRLEMQIVTGQQSIGTVESVTDTGGNTADLEITIATWRPGLWWALGRKATLDAFTSTTKNNASGALKTTGLTISARKVRVSYTGTLGSEVAAGDELYFEGAWDGTTYTEMPGLITQARNLTGTSLGLSATTYPNWSGNRYDVAGNISYEIVEDACSQLRDRGVDMKLTFAIANKGFSVLINELKALRVIDSSYSPQTGKLGHKSVEYFSPDVGQIEILNHPFFNQGEFLLCAEENLARVGSSDMTFGVPGIDTPQWERVAGTSACEAVLFCDQCVIGKEPATMMHGTGITYV